MPPIPKRNDEQDALMMSLLDEFFRESGWSRNRRGNLVRRWGPETLTVFSRGGRYGWCRAFDDDEEDRPEYSSRMFDTEQQAQDDLWDRVGM